MAKYRLLFGRHVQADRARPIRGADGERTGRFERQTFVATHDVRPIVESDSDLVKLFGTNKFEYVHTDDESAREIAELKQKLADAEARAQRQVAGGLKVPGDPTPGNLIDNPATAPGGQVSTGWQGGPPPEAKAAAEGKQPETPKADARDLEADWGDLDRMSVADLKALAEEEEIDLGGARTKDEILKKIRARG